MAQVWGKGLFMEQDLDMKGSWQYYDDDDDHYYSKINFLAQSPKKKKKKIKFQEWAFESMIWLLHGLRETTCPVLSNSVK